MKKTYHGTNNKDIKLAGCLFKKGEVTSVDVIEEDFEHKWSEYYDSDTRLHHIQKRKCQQIVVWTKDDSYTFALWGYGYDDSKKSIDINNKSFYGAVDKILSSLA